MLGHDRWPSVGSRALSADDQNRRDWLDYGGSPDNSRYSTLKQMDKSNVSKPEVAWTYEYGETGFNPIVVNGVVYGKGRNSSLIALEVSITGEQERQGPAAAVLHQRLPSGNRCRDRSHHPQVRQGRRGRSA
jgi:glucose dehydrogenase